MANSTSPVPQVVEGTGAVQKINDLFDAGSQAVLGGRNAATSALLVFGYIGGRVNGINTANGTVTLTASTTNYIVWKKSDGVVSVSTATTNWDNSTDYWRLYSVVTSGSTWTSYTDERSSSLGLFGLGANSMVNPMTTAEDIIKGGSSGTPTRVAVGADGQVLTVTSGVVGWANSASGFSNPMTTAGDIILGGVSGAAGRLAIGADAGMVLTSDGSTAAWAPPRILQNSQSGAYTLVASDAGKHIYHPSADTTARIWTIPANGSVAFPIGTAVTFDNDFGAGAITIAITTDTLVLVGTAGSTGSRTLAPGGQATAIKVTSTRWRISGTGLT
jgi:hypothetical protein